MTNAERWTRLLLILAGCALVSACAPRSVVCKYPDPPKELVKRQATDSQDRLRQFYKTLEPSSPSEPTTTQPSSTP